jgi:hypothetical protein
MIVNVLDCRADHSAIEPVDAMVVSHATEGDGRGVVLARADVRHGVVREDTSVGDALAWAGSLPRGVVLILFGGTSRRTKLADERASEPGAVRHRLLELGIRLPVDGMCFEREQDMLGLLAKALVPSRNARRRRSKRRARRGR